ncbi:sigma-54-dependent Fis family transcriptional regulator [Sporolactobacillus sp. THM7-4]|nr:sigma-54-dependent Fis family transcriptional regulator [Sporolactobacillus sp. THM7-4]
MYVELRQIQSTIQQIVIAISSVLKIEVEVADSNLFRIAGTGLLKQKIWKEMSGEDAVYRQCVESGKPIIIDSPGYHEICKVCPHFGNCVEHGEVCAPIKINQNVIGVIGLIAFNSEQKHRIFDDMDANLFFLQKMAEVIATKVNENMIFRQQLIAEKKISTLINCIDMGVMMLNDKGDCEFISRIAKDMLHLGDDRELNSYVLSQFSKIVTQNRSGHIVWINLGHYQKKFFVTVHQIDGLDKNEAEVIIIEDPDHITRIASHISIEKQNQETHLIGSTTALLNMKQVLSKIRDDQIPILITGEDGTGKSFVAHYVHVLGGKPENKFRKINASYYSESDLNQFLFGDGGEEPGFLEMLDGGTLVLDEVDQIGNSTQLRLTKFMNDKLIQKKQKSFKVNVRMISITNKDLLGMVQEGSFRQDLYYKIGVVPIFMPPLRERKEDIMLLANHFLELLNLKSETEKKIFADQTHDVMLSYDWPGNIQELSNVIEYAYNVSDGSMIRTENFPDYILFKYEATQKRSKQQFNLNILERETIKKALIKVKNEGRKKEDAALLLGIGRATLFRKISEYRINEIE